MKINTDFSYKIRYLHLFSFVYIYLLMTISVFQRPSRSYMLSDNCFSFNVRLFIYYPCVSFHTQPHAGTTHRPTSPLLATSRHLFICTTRRCEPALPCSPASHPFHASTDLYAICTLIRSVAGGRGQDLILERSTFANPHLFLFGDDAAALLSDLPLSNGSGLNAEEDEVMWGGLSSRLQRRDINLI